MKSKIPEVRIEIKPTKMLPGEIGLFAARALRKGAVIAEAELLGEHFFPWDEYKKCDPVTKKKIKQYCLQTQDGFYAPNDFNWLTVPWNMNHSCDFNVGFDDEGNFVTTRVIKKGEELVWDYGMGISDPKFKLICNCKSKKCRGIVTGNDWKDPEFVHRNKLYLMRELLVRTEN